MLDTWKIYLITLDATPIVAGAHPFNMPAFHQYLADSADLGGFWNYIPFVYSVKSRLPIAELRAKLQNFIAPRSFLLVDITNSARDGWLQKQAWDWFNQSPTPRANLGLGNLPSLLDFKPLPDR